jgi:hypothetical protein
MPIEELAFQTARNWHLAVGGHYQMRSTNNLIIHPNGRLYGELAQVGFQTWRMEGDRLIFQGRHRWDTWEFHREADGQWIGWPVNISSLVAALARPSQVSNIDSLPELEQSGHRLESLPEIDVGKARFEIVVAKHREDLAWTDCYRDNVTIYSKDPGDLGRFPILPNRGRDAGTQLYHIVQHYDDLADRTLFLQGHPWDHPVLAIPLYAKDLSPFTVASIIENHMGWSPHWTEPDQMIDEPVMRAFLKLIECDPTITTIHWTQGMQFAASREQIRKRPHDYYRRLFHLSQRESVELDGRRFDNLHIIFLLELFWRDVFMAREQSTAVQPCRPNPRGIPIRQGV